MANAKAIKAKIKSIWNIQKITAALEIVSTVKLQKIKDQTEKFKEYMIEFMYILDKVWNVSNIFNVISDIKTNKELIIVISTEKWLCWSLNSKLFRQVYEDTKDRKKNIDVFCIGKKALEFFTRSGYNVVGTENIKDNFSESDLNATKAMVIESIDKLKYKNIKVYYNYFKNSMVQIPSYIQLFPLNDSWVNDFFSKIGLKIEDKFEDIHDIHIEPSEEDFYDFVYKKFISDIIYGALLQNKTWEQASRMIAMKNAKDNSIQIQKNLKITYNKQRQAAVTQEISEITWAKTAMEE